MMPAKSALPPYAREIVAACQRGETVNLYLYAGHRAWDFAQCKPHAVVVPDDWDRRDWRWIGGLAATLIVRDWTTADTAALAEHLVRSGAPLVVALHVTRLDGRTQIAATHYRGRVAG